MSGTLKINNDASWMPTGWIYDTVILEVICEQLATLNPELNLVFRQVQMGIFQYADLSELSTEKFNLLLDTVRGGFRLLPKPVKSENISNYFYLIVAYSELIALLTVDPRSMDHLEKTGFLILNDAAIWSAPGWAFNMLLEDIAASVYVKDQTLCNQLTSGKVSENSGHVDLHELDPHRFSAMKWAIEWLHGFYGDGKGRISGAPGFFTRLAPIINELCTLYTSDRRLL